MVNKKAVQICVPVCEPSFAAMKKAATQAAQLGEMVELRLDYLEEDNFLAVRPSLERLLTELGRPVILTLRPKEQGGRQTLDRAARISFWLPERPGNAQFLDIELDLASSDGFSSKWSDWERIILSHHDFLGIPNDLEQLFERMMRSEARILKIAFHANDVTDCIPVFRILDRAREAGREMIAIAMGTAGIATRILGPSRGSFLTYGASQDGRASAAGQLTAAELRDLYRIHKIDSETQITGLVGRPVLHSFSPHIHNAAFDSAGVNAVYIPFEVVDPTSFFKRMILPRTREIDWNIRGLSVTAPHKSAVMEHLDWIEPAAREVGAVNTIVVNDDRLHGYNTDCTALIQTLLQKMRNLQSARCAVIGAGGAARSALAGLRQEGAEVTVFARDQNKARPVAERFGAACSILKGSRFEGFDIVINATPLGSRGPEEDRTVADAAQLKGARLAYDLVYNPTETQFLREARDAGCDTLGGLSMLVSQAAEQFKLWTGVEAPKDVMQKAAEQALNNV